MHFTTMSLIYGDSTEQPLRLFCKNREQINTLDAFRPINIIPVIINIISKLMAKRLQTKMPLLIDIHQLAFVHDRSLIETFWVARELIHFRTKNKIPSVVLKIDFRKAFDTISWDFLYNIMNE
jgi:Reverse transcriptase (RNA-dependent DNA polymerase)